MVWAFTAKVSELLAWLQGSHRPLSSEQVTGKRHKQARPALHEQLEVVSVDYSSGQTPGTDVRGERFP